MRNLVTIIVVLLAFNATAQQIKIDNNVSVDNLIIELEVKSKSELSQFKLSDFKSLVKGLDENASIEFKIVCKNDNQLNKKVMSYSVKGNTNDTKSFFKMSSKIKRSAITYYNNQKTI